VVWLLGWGSQGPGDIQMGATGQLVCEVGGGEDLEPAPLDKERESMRMRSYKRG